MLSIASVRSASGAANYFASDNYYTAEQSSEMSVWAGSGSEDLGLSGAVGKDSFEAILNGILPSGEGVAQVENRRAGYDLTFSMPKSASVLAYVAGDKRILTANQAAVQKAMNWVEKNLAEGRKGADGTPVRTGNLVYALFQHDTSRALDPQAHIHAVVANLTRLPDGKWQALHADKLWSNNSVIGSIYHAYLRSELEKLGYSVELKGKHGAFEIAGVPKPVIEAFSQRREQILEQATKIGASSPEALREITKRTRDPKLDVDDRDGLRKEWIDRAAALGFDGKDVVRAAAVRAELMASTSMLDRGYRAVGDAISSARERLDRFLRPADPLVDRGLARLTQSPEAARAQLAVASAVRILSEREAAYPANKLAKTALDLGLKGVTLEHVDARIEQLKDRGVLLVGAGRASEFVTTREALRVEEAILARVDEGKGLVRPIIAADQAPERLQAAAERPLNAGQLGAATLILSSTDRTVVVQGVAGAGKSTMLAAVARVAEQEGKAITGLAFQNKMVADLAEGAGIKAQTLASFAMANERYVEQRSGPGYEAARAAHAGSMLLVDETSMVSSGDMLKLHDIADALGVEKLVLVGDRQQLSSIEAGKSFAMIQASGGTMARMDENLRQRTDQLRTVAALANRGKASEAIRVMGDKVETAAQPAEHAADLWLGLDAAEREVTAVFASGRDARATINQRIQAGLAAEGTLKGEGVQVTVFERVNTTREELRHASTYRPGMTLEVGKGGATEVGLLAGRYDVVSITARGKVELRSGNKRIWIEPQKLSLADRRSRIQLTEKKDLQLREGDQIRWTANDKERGLHNSAIARVISADEKGVIVETAAKERLTLDLTDPMLSRVDLAYALNMHMAQGITTDKAIGVMNSSERNLSNQRLFNVLVTRVRDALTLVVDDNDRLSRQLDHSPGDKTSSLETRGVLEIDGNRSGGGRATADPGLANAAAGLPPVDEHDLPPLPPGDGRPILPPGSEQQRGSDARTPAKPDRDVLPALPERQLGLDL